MKELTLFTIETPYRQPLAVKGWQFGNPDKKSLAVMGSLRGNEIQQMYVCAKLIQTLRKAEANGQLSEDAGILVVPCANQFSMNVGSRFWAADHTDINRMFPGYYLGETTQRIADRIFTALQGYRYGFQMASFYLAGDFLPHARIMRTGYENVEQALDFGLPYVVLRNPKPYDTTTLNYNWQVWETQAYSLYSGETASIDPDSAQIIIDAVMRFLKVKGLSCYKVPEGAEQPRIVPESEMETIHSKSGGMFFRYVKPGSFVRKNELLAEILDPYTCDVTEKIRSHIDGRLYFSHKSELIAGHEIAFRIIPEKII